MRYDIKRYIEGDIVKFFVEQRVLDLGLKIKFVLIEDLDNESISDGYIEFRENYLKKLKEKYEYFNIEEDEILNGFDIIHRNGGISNRKNISASKNLIKMLKLRNDLTKINKVVDIYNLISIDSKLCLGAHDTKNVSGDVTLKICDGSENFIPVGEDTPHKIKSGEYSYCDSQNDVLCRLEVRQVEKTKVTNQTKNVFYIVEGNMNTSEELLNDIAKKIIDETTKYCGGVGRVAEVNII